MQDQLKISQLIFIFSILAICFAFFLQYFLGHQPCKLCIYQRIPYYIVVFVSVLYLIFKKYFKIYYSLLIFLLLSEFFISNYHTLSTFGILNYSGCESATLPKDITKLKDALMSDSLVVNCSNANLKFFSVPLSVYNSLFSFVFLLLITINEFKKKN